MKQTHFILADHDTEVPMESAAVRAGARPSGDSGTHPVTPLLASKVTPAGTEPAGDDSSSKTPSRKQEHSDT